HRVEPGDLFGHEDSLSEASVGELETGHDVTDRIHSWNTSAEPLVGDDKAFVESDTGLSEAEPIGDRPTADCHEEKLRVDRVPFVEGDPDAASRVFHPGETRCGTKADPALAERPLDGGGHGFVLGRDE